MPECTSAAFSPGRSAAEALCSARLSANLAVSRSMLRASPEDGASASTPSSASLMEPKRAFKHSLQLLVGSPCQHSCSTNPSLAHSILPSNWQNLRCNRKEQRQVQQARNRLPALGSPCHAPPM